MNPKSPERKGGLSAVIQSYIEAYVRSRIGDDPMDRLKQLVRENAAEIQARRQENTARVIAEINRFGDSLEFGDLIARYAKITTERNVNDTDSASGAVAYAALYPTFGDEGISQLVAAWVDTSWVRRNITD